MEIWKDIKAYEGLYQISNSGNVRSLDRYETNGRTMILYKGKMLSKAISHSNKGYYIVSLSKKGKSTKKYIHRLIAEAFIPNPNNYPCINHKNENKLDNRIENLEWCTDIYNINYGNRNKKASKNISKRIVQISKDNKIIKVWDSIDKAQKELKISNISSCCLNKRKTSGGYIWKYEREVL